MNKVGTELVLNIFSRTEMCEAEQTAGLQDTGNTKHETFCSEQMFCSEQQLDTLSTTSFLQSGRTDGLILVLIPTYFLINICGQLVLCLYYPVHVYCAQYICTVKVEHELPGQQRHRKLQTLSTSNQVKSEVFTPSSVSLVVAWGRARCR